MSKILGFIPARMAASRFPGKPMIEHVYERTKLFPRWDVLARKDALALELVRRLARLGLEPDYAVAVMRAAADRIAILETLVEIEAIKYTLAARRVRELDPEEEGG